MDARARHDAAEARQWIGATLEVLAFAALCGASMHAAAVGTAAGGRIDSAAQMTYAVGGVAQSPVTSNATSMIVDEVLDCVVVDQDAAPVAVASGATGAALTFDVTNTGNGSEPMRLAIETALAGDDFDPTSAAIYLESNGTPGLQIGAGGDTAYTAGANDPVLARDASALVYVASSIPLGLAPGAIGRTALRAVPRTVFAETGTDDPANAAFPVPGTTYPGAGDAAIGGGNVAAVVGSTFARNALKLRALGAYAIDAGAVTLTKVATSVSDPRGGNRVLPGSIVHYQITVAVAPSGSAHDLVVRDPLPATLGYVPSSLTVAPLPAGQQADDDFLPAGVDGTGFDGANDAVVVTLGDLAGGAQTVISFNATVR